MALETRRRVPISKVVVGDDEIDAVVEVLRSGSLREGAECKAFEHEFAELVGTKHALTASSGTAALQMAYQAILQPGDEVVVPAFTFFATASMVAAVGAVPVFCDVNPETLTIDVEDAARRITPRTRAIAPVHLFGNPVDVGAVVELSAAHGLAVIWDAAQAHGTRYRGQDVGGLSGMVCYSFYPSKNMTTGEGGMVCTDDGDLAARMKLLRGQGQARKYWHTALGYNFRMTDFQAAMGRCQLRRLPGWVEQRRANAGYLQRRLAESPRLRIQREQPGGTHSYHQFSVILDEQLDRDAVMERLRGSGIECAVHYPTPLHLQPFFAPQTQGISLPVSEAAARQIMSVPVHPYLSADDLQAVADTVLEVVNTA